MRNVKNVSKVVRDGKYRIYADKFNNRADAESYMATLRKNRKSIKMLGCSLAVNKKADLRSGFFYDFVVVLWPGQSFLLQPSCLS